MRGLCSKCDKPNGHYRDKASPSGWKSQCKDCENQSQYRWRKTFKGQLWSKRGKMVAQMRRILKRKAKAATDAAKERK